MDQVICGQKIGDISENISLAQKKIQPLHDKSYFFLFQDTHNVMSKNDGPSSWFKTLYTNRLRGHTVPFCPLYLGKIKTRLEYSGADVYRHSSFAERHSKNKENHDDPSNKDFQSFNC